MSGRRRPRRGVAAPAAFLALLLGTGLATAQAFSRKTPRGSRSVSIDGATFRHLPPDGAVPSADGVPWDGPPAEAIPLPDGATRTIVLESPGGATRIVLRPATDETRRAIRIEVPPRRDGAAVRPGSRSPLLLRGEHRRKEAVHAFVDSVSGESLEVFLPGRGNP